MEESDGTVSTLPYLLQLASMSPMLLHILATDLINKRKLFNISF